MRKRGRKAGNMGRAPCCNKGEVKKGAWTPEEDKLLVDYITKHGHGTWRSFPKLAGLRRCGKSCRCRWTNYLRPDIKRGAFSYEEEQTIFNLHRVHGNKWAAIASRLPGRTDNEIKNLWNSHLRKRLPGRTDNEIKNLWNSHLRKRIPKSSSPSTSAETKHSFSPAGHMGEMENKDTTVESMDPMLLIPDGSSENNNINMLHEWGSCDGDTFNKHMSFDKVACEIPTLGAMKFESGSCDHVVKERVRVKMEAEEAEEILTNGLESQGSFEADNSSDITLDLLLDFPNDGEYLQYE